MTIDNEQLTIMVSLRDKSNNYDSIIQIIPFILDITEFFYLSPKGIPSLSIINYQLSIVNSDKSFFTDSGNAHVPEKEITLECFT